MSLDYLFILTQSPQQMLDKYFLFWMSDLLFTLSPLYAGGEHAVSEADRSKFCPL